MSIDRAMALGGYVQGMLDSAASRGVFSHAAQQTLLRALVKMHGGDFELESPPEINQPTIEAPKVKIAGS